MVMTPPSFTTRVSLGRSDFAKVWCVAGHVSSSALDYENRDEIAKGGNAYGDLWGWGTGLQALLGGLVDGKGEGEEGGRTMLSLVSPSFLPMSWFCQSAVLSLLPSLDMRPGTTRGMVADI